MMPNTLKPTNNTLHRVRRAALLGVALGAGALPAAGCGKLTGETKDPQAAQAKATGRYEKTYKTAVPVGKFILQYLSTSQVYVLKGGTGLDNRDYRKFSYGNHCLRNTAYDVAGGNINGSVHGWFVSGKVSGRVPTAAAFAYVDAVKTPDEMTVKSGNTNSIDLHFTGVQGEALEPADDETRNLLGTYGCKVGLVGRAVQNTLGSAPTSKWIVK